MAAIWHPAYNAFRNEFVVSLLAALTVAILTMPLTAHSFDTSHPSVHLINASFQKDYFPRGLSSIPASKTTQHNRIAASTKRFDNITAELDTAVRNDRYIQSC